MSKPLKALLCAAPLLLASAALPARAADTADAGVKAKPVFAQGSMNVFRRVPEAERPKMVEFYDKALGLKPLSPINLSSTQQMMLFGVGGGQIKIAAGLTKDRQYHPGGAIGDATGIRIYTLTYPDEAAVKARFAAAGYPEPVFKDIGGGKREAVVKDPSGFSIGLVVSPGAATDGVEVGINVSNLERSRAFYRDFEGLEELPPVKDPILGTTKYPFRNGQTTISLFKIGNNLPADTGSAGIQYVIKNIDDMNARALAEHVKVETPLGGLQGFPGLKTVWLNDPDGVTDYFYQMDRTAARTASASASANAGVGGGATGVGGGAPAAAK
jgi:catechol 2,3-dioxygenase-like lactoylglutathione lyase family enzyme